MQSFRAPIVLAALFGLLALLAFAPAAEACCRPCGSWCDTVAPSSYCCSGVPEPGNICGLTTCGEWSGGGPAVEILPAWMAVTVDSSCDIQATAATTETVEPADAIKVDEPVAD